MNYSQELIDIALLDIPVSKEKEDGFLDITGQQYKEVIISRIYSYFLNRRKNPAISDLFINCLLEIINTRKQINLTLPDYECETEIHTNKGNRIDLLVFSKREGQSIMDEALIIENKIFHKIDNDFKDYWDSIKAKKKIGVVLSIKKLDNIRIDANIAENFINITHNEWFEKIKSIGLPTGLNIKDYVYLNDFINNMVNMKNNITINEQARFFFENTETILNAQKVYEEACIYVTTQLQITSNEFGGGFYKSSQGYVHIWNPKNHPQVYYAIAFDSIFSTNPEISIFIEIDSDALQKEGKLRELLRCNKCYEILDDDKMSKNGWAHLAYKTYKLTLEDISDLSNFLLKQIDKDFMPFMDLIIRFLNKK